ncbi:MAG: hypothetical protein ACRETT_10405 [Steroidobacteraceae bacterium]
MRSVRVGLLLLGSALFLQACATSGAPARHTGGSEADQLILGVMNASEQSCPGHLITYCIGTGRINLQCSCESPQALAPMLQSLSGTYY